MGKLRFRAHPFRWARAFPVLLFASLAAVQATAADITEVVLFSGGVNAQNNYSRYYNNMSNAFDVFSALYGKAHVWVLYADGSSITNNQNTGTFAAPTYTTSDWTKTAAGHYLSATHDNLMTTIEDTVPEDAAGRLYSFVFYSFDHGSSQNPMGNGCDCGNDINNVLLNGWVIGADNNTITNQEFSTWGGSLTAQAELYDFNECYSKGMTQPLLGNSTGNIFVSWAASYCSYGSGYADAFVNAIGTQGLRGTASIGQYAVANDPFGPNGVGANKNLEDPGYAGFNFDITTNQSVPEPAYAFSALAAMMGMMFLRTRFPRRT